MQWTYAPHLRAIEAFQGQLVKKCSWPSILLVYTKTDSSCFSCFIPNSCLLLYLLETQNSFLSPHLPPEGEVFCFSVSGRMVILIVISDTPWNLPPTAFGRSDWCGCFRWQAGGRGSSPFALPHPNPKCPTSNSLAGLRVQTCHVGEEANQQELVRTTCHCQGGRSKPSDSLTLQPRGSRHASASVSYPGTRSTMPEQGPEKLSCVSSHQAHPLAPARNV